VISRVANKKMLLVRFPITSIIVFLYFVALHHASKVLDCVENVPPDTLLGVWKELSAASEQLRLLMTTRSLFATQDLEDYATTVEIRRLSRRASIDLLRNIVKVLCTNFCIQKQLQSKNKPALGNSRTLSPKKQPHSQPEPRIEIVATKNSISFLITLEGIQWLFASSAAA
jgi:hypothetical protein